MKSKTFRPTPGWTTWTFCTTLDRLLREVDINTASGLKARLELIQADDGWDLYTYELEAPSDS